MKPRREFYSIEQHNDGKFVHYFGFVDADGGYETGYRHTAMTGCMFNVNEVPTNFFPFDYAEHLAESVTQYLQDLNESEYWNMVRNVEGCTYLHMDNVGEDTPCGMYYFDSDEDRFFADYDTVKEES